MGDGVSGEKVEGLEGLEGLEGGVDEDGEL